MKTRVCGIYPDISGDERAYTLMSIPSALKRLDKHEEANFIRAHETVRLMCVNGEMKAHKGTKGWVVTPSSVLDALKRKDGTIKSAKRPKIAPIMTAGHYNDNLTSLEGPMLTQAHLQLLGDLDRRVRILTKYVKLHRDQIKVVEEDHGILLDILTEDEGKDSES